MTDLKFPIGPFTFQDSYTDEDIENMITSITAIPAMYRELTENLSDETLQKTYREGSWNIRQLVHHVADTHILHYMRLKKAVTEPSYDEATLIDINSWAVLPDAMVSSVEDSLVILEGVHKRYTTLARTLSDDQLLISYLHPVRKLRFNQKQAIAILEWHGRHHLAHIALALKN
ncbi:Putative metal-dependent hydrolase YfiT [Dyadobacter sp. CECT 9275]|uniref:Metal-dependent hydrolase YfiT n=1 Tax=Dyadobacter helix TaxID=2822344 RepID=A0A916JDM5_9BACT|nr:putative metal-dependent hydrolase [Dyadobacter sp. CECT 9275]CAG5005322.1 Putative metal-dependent hydrolase YfiT [Dyadobacter sp. CECT 9275]